MPKGNFGHLGRPGLVGGSQSKSNLSQLFLILKGSSRSGNFGHAGRKGKRGGSSSNKISGFIGEVDGARVYKIEGEIHKDFINSKHAAFLLAPDGNLYGWTNGEVHHAQVVGSPLFNDNKNFDFYTRVDRRVSDYQFNNEPFFIFDSMLAGVGPIYSSHGVDEKAEKNFKKLARKLVSNGLPKDSHVKWVTSESDEIKGKLEDWL